MDEHSCRKNGKKSCECAGIHNHQKEVASNSQATKEFVCSWDQWNTIFFFFGGGGGGRGLGGAKSSCLNQWLELPDEKPDWLTKGRTVLLPKTEDLTNERNYCPVTSLNTCYKIFKGMIGNCMKEHAERNNIWDRSQLGTCSRILGTADQLTIDNAIMDEVRNQQRNLAVPFYDYQKAYNMVRHDWMIRV